MMATRATSLFHRSHVRPDEGDKPRGADAAAAPSRTGAQPDQLDAWLLMRYTMGRNSGTLARYAMRQRVQRRQTRFLVVVTALFALWCIFRFV